MLCKLQNNGLLLRALIVIAIFRKDVYINSFIYWFYISVQPLTRHWLQKAIFLRNHGNTYGEKWIKSAFILQFKNSNSLTVFGKNNTFCNTNLPDKSLHIGYGWVFMNCVLCLTNEIASQYKRKRQI